MLTTNSGSSANLLAVSALTSPALGERALRRGDEVITTAVSFPTTVNPILLYGLVPVFVDVDIPTYNADLAAVEAAITDKTVGQFAQQLESHLSVSGRYPADWCSGKHP